MWDILRRSLVTSTDTPDLTGIADLDLVLIDGTLYLLATTRAAPGMTVLSIDATTADLSLFDREVLPNEGVFPPMGAEIIWVSDTPILVPTGRNDTALPSFQMETDGTIGSNWAVSAFDSNPLALAQYTSGGDNFVLVSQSNDAAIKVFRDDEVGGLVLTSETAVLFDVNILAIAMVDTVQIALAAYENGNTVETFTLSPSGELTLVSEGGPEQQVGIAGISSIRTVELPDKTFALIAGFGSSSITVLEVMQTGDLVPTDHVLDTLNTRFSRTSELLVIEDGSRILILLSGNDDGFSVLQLLPNGRLIHRATIADATDTTLDNVSGLQAHLIENTLNVYATSESEAGITHFTIDIGVRGQTVEGTGASDSLTGSDWNDIIFGDGGDDTLTGGAGDDVISDGNGEDQLAGGAGRDVFLLTQDGALDQILDFEPGFDQIDLSLFDFLFSVQGLVIETTEYGARITFQEDITDVYRAGGGGLELADLGGDDLLALSHGVLPKLDDPAPDPAPNPLVSANFKTVSSTGRSSGEGGRDGYNSGWNTQKIFFMSKAGNNTILGSDLDDTLNGGLGHDTIDGSGGNDVLIGSEGADTFVFGLGADRIADFDAEEDVIRLDSALWDNNAMTSQQIVESFGNHSASEMVLDFGDGNQLAITGEISQHAIIDALIFF